MILLVGVYASLTEALAAQVTLGERADDPLGYGFVRAGILRLNLDALNADLASVGLPQLDESVPTWGGGGYGRVGRFYLGGEGHGGLDPTALSGSTRIALKGGYGLARVKYQALTVAGLGLYPALGVGAGGMSLQVAGLDVPTFDEVLDDPARSSTLSTGLVPLLNAGIALDYRLQVQELDDGRGWGLLLGVEGGYVYAPGGTSWTLDGVNHVAGGPELGIEGFYLWFSLGGWGREGVAPGRTDP